MAKYWEHLKYHEDTVEKHAITSEEIQFLMELQKEMNTQDHVSQADPRYWVIRDFQKVYGGSLNNPDGYEIFMDGEQLLTIDYEMFNDTRVVDAVKEYFLREYKTDFEEADFEDMYDIDDLKDMLEDRGYEISIVEYEIVPKYSGMFLTQKAAEEHLRANDYHYADNATTYAMTAWRSHEADMLYKILQSVDFGQMLAEVQENQCENKECPYYKADELCPAKEGCAGYERSADI